MVFRKMMRALGVGGPSVETVLSSPGTRPGGVIEGQVHIVGGDAPCDIEHVALGLVTRAETESGDNEWHGDVEFAREAVAGSFALTPGVRHSLPFRFAVPWETPLTHVFGQHLRGMVMGVRTELSVARAVDSSDLDPVAVHPLPAQEALLDAFAALGFRFHTADVERGRIHGVHQLLPFFQEIEFYPPPQYARGINQLEVTFVARPESMDLVLEMDKRGGLLTEGQDAFGRFVVEYRNVDQVDWTAHLSGWLQQASQRRGFAF